MLTVSTSREAETKETKEARFGEKRQSHDGIFEGKELVSIFRRLVPITKSLTERTDGGRMHGRGSNAA